MRKIGFKIMCVFTLVFFVMSMTGAAACPKCKTDARDDKFTVDLCKKSNCFNVLKNDKGCGLKVVTTGYIKTAKGGQVLMKSDGSFCYVKPVSCSSKSDSFTYKAVNKNKQYDTAKVTLNLKCTDCSKKSSSSSCSKKVSSCSKKVSSCSKVSNCPNASKSSTCRK